MSNPGHFKNVSTSVEKVHLAKGKKKVTPIKESDAAAEVVSEKNS